MGFIRMPAHQFSTYIIKKHYKISYAFCSVYDIMIPVNRAAEIQRRNIIILSGGNIMKILFLSPQGNKHQSDLYDVLTTCGVSVEAMSVKEAVYSDISVYDAYCVLGNYGVIDPRVRERLEAESASKHIFLEAVNSFFGIYSDGPAGTTRSRLVYIKPDEGGIDGLETGDLLDDEANRMLLPYFTIEGYKPLLVYREHLIAHTHTSLPPEEIMNGSKCGLWMIGENVMMSSFTLHNFVKARFAPRTSWKKLIVHIAKWLTGNTPAELPKPVLTYGVSEDFTDDEVFEKCRRNAIERGMSWMREYLVDDGKCGILEGLRHNISPEGNQTVAGSIRTDCSGEASGAFKFYAKTSGDSASREIGDNIDSFIYGPMQVHGGLFDGMLRWTDSAWQVCYQDDAARAILPGLYDCIFMGNDELFEHIRPALDFLVNTTAQDGCRTWRTDMPGLDEAGLQRLREAAEGNHSAHYNAYYHAALLMGYKYSHDERYLATAKKGLETLMSLYPDTVREQSETEEKCRLVFPLAALYEATGEEKHKEMLYRVVRDLEEYRHPSGGYREWDTGYRATCSRNSAGECSLLTENGDPVADLLYSVNWLPIGFAYAYYATGDEWFRSLWRGIVGFFLKSQIICDDPKLNGCWCRGFDMNLGEAYGCPHDVGWAANASESGWTNAEILMGMMMPEILK